MEGCPDTCKFDVAANSAVDFASSPPDGTADSSVVAAFHAFIALNDGITVIPGDVANARTVGFGRAAFLEVLDAVLQNAAAHRVAAAVGRASLTITAAAATPSQQ